ncbi:TPA: hypothetical protein ACH3X2_006221 [Trebouxia sp. C0005]
MSLTARQPCTESRWWLPACTLLYTVLYTEVKVCKSGWDFQQLEDLQALQSIRWWYDWGPSSNPSALKFASEHNIEFVPMQWGKWGIENLTKVIDLQAKHLLGMNEPGHQQQSNLEPAEAAALWPAMEQVANKMGLRLGTPSPAPCGVQCVRSSPFQWFDEFFEACKGCRFDFLATHIYTCNADALKWYINDCKKYKLPIWLTEFACPNGDHGPTDRQQTFMSDALKILDMDEAVERHAWFAPRTSGDWLGPSASLLQADKPKLTELGKLYTQYPGMVLLQTEETQSWTNMCSHCFLLSESLTFNDTAKQLCSDCGFKLW